MKKTIFVIIMLIHLGGCSMVNLMKMRAANDNIKPLWNSDKTQYMLDTQYIGVKPHVMIAINGQPGFLMHIDTGLSFSMLFDTEKVNRMNFDKGYELPIFGWGDDASSTGFQTLVDTIDVGPVRVDDFNFAVLPVSKSLYFHSAEEMIFDGVLGNDFLQHFAWTFDYKSGHVSLSNVPVNFDNDTTTIAFEQASRKITIPITLHFANQPPHQLDVKIDTGSRHYLKINTAFVDNRDIQLPRVMINASDFGLSGEAQHQRFRLQQLGLGNLTLDGVKTNLIEADDEDDFNVIGSALFAHYSMTIDYLSETISFIRNSDQPFSSRFNLTGLELREQRDGSFIVRSVAHGFEASKHNIVVGDVIEKINDIETTNISTAQWLDIANTPGPLSLCFSDSKCIDLMLKPIAGFSEPFLTPGLNTTN